MTLPAPPRLASYLLQRFAFGPRRESLVGDIVEQFQQGRSSRWLWRQTLATIFIGSAAFVRAYPHRAVRASVLTIMFVSAIATATWLFLTPSRNWLITAFNVGIIVYCSVGFIVLITTITSLDEPLSLRLSSPDGRSSSARRIS